MSDGILKKDHILGKYRIDKEIGRGAVGVVYKAHDPSIDRMVAIKTLLPDLLNSDKKDELTLRFQQEAKAAARCAHANILTIYEYAEEGDIPFIAMEYVQGEELKKFLKDFIRFKIQDVVVITQQILAALKFAHSKQVIHRDIKPANIILLKRKQIKITDFGVARIEDDSENITESSTMIGTPNYMSPEQLNTEPLDNRTDLYSAGLILFELLSRAKTDKNNSYKPRGYQLRDDVDLTEDWLKEFIPDEFLRVMFTALQKDPQERFQNAAQFSTAILKAYKAYLVNNEEVTNRNRSSLGQAIDARQKTPAKPEINSNNPAPQSINWSPDILKQLETQLALFMGPFAKVLVTQNSHQYRSIQRFIEALANKIPDEDEKSSFISTVSELCEGSIPDIVTASSEETMGGQGDGVTAIFDNSVLTDIEHKLAFFVGPIAKALVIKEANKSTSRGDLYRKLSSYIPVESERTEFLSKVAR